MVSINRPNGTKTVDTILLTNMIGNFNEDDARIFLELLVAEMPRILITGETGTGKSTLANYLYRGALKKGRIKEEHRRGKFKTQNMAAIPSGMETSILFGWCRGSFTGAVKDGIGAFEQARGGVLFLDEIHHSKKDVQKSLLVALQDRKYTRVGGEKEESIDAWIIGGSTEPERIIDELYFRVGEVVLELTPLRERGPGLGEIVSRILSAIVRERGWMPALSDKALNVEDSVVDWIHKQEWPGNIREIESFLRTASLFIAVPEMGLRLEHIEAVENLRSSARASIHEGNPIAQYLRMRLPREPAMLREWKRMIARAYYDFYGKREEAAAALGIDRKTLSRLLAQ